MIFPRLENLSFKIHTNQKIPAGPARTILKTKLGGSTEFSIVLNTSPLYEMLDIDIDKMRLFALLLILIAVSVGEAVLSESLFSSTSSNILNDFVIILSNDSLLCGHVLTGSVIWRLRTSSLFSGQEITSSLVKLFPAFATGNMLAVIAWSSGNSSASTTHGPAL